MTHLTHAEGSRLVCSDHEAVLLPFAIEVLLLQGRGRERTSTPTKATAALVAGDAQARGRVNGAPTWEKAVFVSNVALAWAMAPTMSFPDAPEAFIASMSWPDNACALPSSTSALLLR